MSERTCFLILDHHADDYFRDLVCGIRTYCEGDIAWYDSGGIGSSQHTDGVPRLRSSRTLAYAKEAPFFFDCFEWAAEHGYDFMVNVETDMAFINPGFEDYVRSAMVDYDYLAPNLRLRTPVTSRWHPYNSLRKELPELLGLIGIDRTHATSNPGQIFSARFIKSLLDAPFYGALRDFVERNQAPERSSSLPEVLMPTLVEALGLRLGGYSDRASAYNRYRPYHALRSIQQAVSEGVHFVHPVRRDPEHPARQYIRARLRMAAENAGGTPALPGEPAQNIGVPEVYHAPGF